MYLCCIALRDAEDTCQCDLELHALMRDCAMHVQIDQPGSAIDAYIGGLRDVLERKASNIAQLQGRLESFQASAGTVPCIRSAGGSASGHAGASNKRYVESCLPGM